MKRKNEQMTIVTPSVSTIVLSVGKTKPLHLTLTTRAELENPYDMSQG